MKKIDLITETQRIRELMNVSVLNESVGGGFKLPSSAIRKLMNIIQGRTPQQIDFSGVDDSVLSTVLPKIFSDKTDDGLLEFIRTAGDISPEQLRILLKVNDDEIRNIFIESLKNDDIIRRLVKGLVRAEEGGDDVAEKLAKDEIGKFMDDDILDLLKSEVKTELDAEKAAKIAQQTAIKTTRILSASEEIDKINKLLDDFADDSKMTIYKSKSLRDKLETVVKRFEKLKKSEYDKLTAQLQRDLDNIDLKIKELSPDLQTKIKRIFERYSDLGTMGKFFVLVAILASPIGGAIASSDIKVMTYLKRAANNFLSLLGFKMENNQLTPTTPQTQPNPSTPTYTNDKAGMERWLKNQSWSGDIKQIISIEPKNGNFVVNVLLSDDKNVIRTFKHDGNTFKITSN